jgi:hypothetical protein
MRALRTRFFPSVVIAAGCALAQDRGTIVGTITDTSGAAVPAAAVTLRNPAMGFSQTAMSSQEGSYTFVYLAVGKYVVTVEKDGFRKAEINDIQVQVNTTSRIDVRMQLGTVQEVVEVQSTATLLQADRTDLGRVVDNRAIQKLPLFINGGLRSNLAFAALVPGVIMNLQNDPDTGGGSPRIAGGVQNGASLLVDGAESMSERRNDPAMRVVSAEGIEEFKVQSGAYTAEFGRTSNGVLNYTTKSGTNEFHGTFMAQHRNEHMNARGFSWGATGARLQRQNLFSTGIGGPIYVPKVYDGRNKAFFFFAGERSRAKSADSSGLITLPIQDFRNGDFRRYTNAQGVVPLYDPFDAAGNIIADASQRQRMQCNGVLNVICPERIHPIAKTILGKLPLPDDPNTVFLNTRTRYNTIGGSRVPGTLQGVYSIKGDYNATNSLRFNGMFSRQYFDNYTLTGPIPGPLAEAFQEFGVTKYYRLNSDYVIRPNLLNHFTFGVNLRDLGEGPVLGLDDAYRTATLMPGVSADKAPNYTKYNTEFGNYGGHVNTVSPGRTYSISNQVAWLKGRHSMKFGFQFMRNNYRRIDCNSCAGQVNFSAAATGIPSIANTGIGYASFLLGISSGGNFNYGADIDFLFYYYAWYFQDDIKLTSKLTLQAGLRYDLPFPRLERNRQNSNFNPSLPNPDAGGLLGALEFAGEGPGRGGRDRLQFVRKNGFGPRLGIAYQLSPRTVLRAGGSIVYDSIREDNNADTGIQGFGGNFSTQGNFLSNGIAFRFQNGFLEQRALVEASRPPRIGPSIVNFQSPSYKAGEAGMPGYYADYNFTLEHSFTQNTLWRASFHANYGIKTQMTQTFNQLDPRYFSFGNLLSSPLSTALNNPTVIASGFRLPYPGYPTNNQLQQALRPYPHYTNVNGTSLAGHSTYNALETSFERRFSGGMYGLFSYTFSKWLSSVEAQNVYSQLTEKVINGADRPHVLAISYVYDLPFGKGKRYMNSVHPVTEAILGNWSISAVHRYQSGTALGVGCQQNMFGAGSARCSLVPGQDLRNPNWDRTVQTSQYLNRAAFVQPANMVYGNLPALIAQLRQPWQLNEDLAISKTFNLTERMPLEFRTSAFNASNRHLLGGLQTNINSVEFGRFSNPQSNLPRSIQFSLRLSF